MFPRSAAQGRHVVSGWEVSLSWSSKVVVFKGIHAGTSLAGNNDRTRQDQPSLIGWNRFCSPGKAVVVEPQKQSQCKTPLLLRNAIFFLLGMGFMACLPLWLRPPSRTVTANATPPRATTITEP